MTDYVRFSNRPVWVKHFRTIHDSSVDVAHGVVVCTGNLNPNDRLLRARPEARAGWWRDEDLVLQAYAES